MSNIDVENEKRIPLSTSMPTVSFELPAGLISKGERKGTSFKVNTLLHRLLKACAALQDRQEGDLVNEAIADLLVKYNYLDIKK